MKPGGSVLLAITDSQLTIIIASIPATIGAIGAFVATLTGNRSNRVQHDKAIADIKENQQLLVNHAAKMGTLERRHVDRQTGATNADVVSSDTGRPGIAEPTG